MFIINVVNVPDGVTGIGYFPVPGPVQLPYTALGLVHVSAEDGLHRPDRSGSPGSSGGRHVHSNTTTLTSGGHFRLYYSSALPSTDRKCRAHKPETNSL